MCSGHAKPKGRTFAVSVKIVTVGKQNTNWPRGKTKPILTCTHGWVGLLGKNKPQTVAARVAERPRVNKTATRDKCKTHIAPSVPISTSACKRIVPGQDRVWGCITSFFVLIQFSCPSVFSTFGRRRGPARVQKSLHSAGLIALNETRIFRGSTTCGPTLTGHIDSSGPETTQFFLLPIPSLECLHTYRLTSFLVAPLLFCGRPRYFII